jgi:hypothetical protein
VREIGDDAALERECRVFTSYLTGGAADAYVLARYVAAQRLSTRDGDRAIDLWLLGVAALGPWGTGVADAYAGLARRSSVLRRKLALLVAILENAPAHHRRFDSASAGRARALAGLAVAGASFALRLVLGVTLFGPVDLAGRLRRPRDGDEP